MNDNTEKPGRTVWEEIEVTGGQLIDKIKELIRQGNIRTIKVRAGEDFTLEMPMTVGALASGVVVLTAPWLAVIGVIAAMVARVRIEVERDAPADTRPDAAGTAPEPGQTAPGQTAPGQTAPGPTESGQTAPGPTESGPTETDRMTDA